MRHLTKDEGVLLRRSPFGEAHLIVHILTKHHGRVAAAAYGARKPGSRYGSSLEPATLAEVSFTRRRRDSDVEELREVRVIRARANARKGTQKIGGLCHAVELAHILSPPGEEPPHCYETLNEFLDWLDSKEDRRNTETCLRVLEVRLLDGTGVFPDLESCAVCSKKLGKEIWAAGTEGLVCECTGAPTPEYLRIDPGAVTFCRDARTMTFERAARARLTRRCATTTKEFLSLILREYTGRDPKALRIMESLS